MCKMRQTLCIYCKLETRRGGKTTWASWRRWEDVIKMVHKGTWCKDVNSGQVASVLVVKPLVGQRVSWKAGPLSNNRTASSSVKGRGLSVMVFTECDFMCACCHIDTHQTHIWRQSTSVRLTLILLTWRKWWTPNNASKWQMGFNSAFKGLNWRIIEGGWRGGHYHRIPVVVRQL